MSKHMLPSSWAVAEFDDVFEPQSDHGRRVSESDYLTEGILPVIDQGEKAIGGYCNDENLKFPGELPVILFGDHTRRVKFVEHDFVVGAQGIKILKPNAGLNPRFLYYQFPILALPDKGYSRHYQYLRKMPFNLAPRKEQDNVVDEVEKQFTRLDAATTALKRVQANLKRYRASVLKAACEGRLVPTEAELARKEGRDYEPGDKLLERILRERRSRWEGDTLAKMIASGKPPKDDRWKEKYEEPITPNVDQVAELPEGWCWASLDQLSWRTQYGSSAKCESEGDIAVLRMGNIQTDGSISTEGNLKYLPTSHEEFPMLLLESGDLLFNRTNSAELVGKSAVYLGTPAPCSFASYLIRVSFVPGCDPQYISACLNSALGRGWIKQVVNQQVGQANVNGSKLRAFSIPLPPESEQGRITANIATALTYIKRASKASGMQVDRQQRLRQAILRDAFLGRLVAQNPNDEPAFRLLEHIRAERTDSALPKSRTRQQKESTYA